MPGYIKKALHKFQHPEPNKPQHAPHYCTVPAYVSKVQYDQIKPGLSTLDPYGTQWVQYIAGNLLQYYQEVEPTMISALNKISTRQSKPTAHTINKYNRLIYFIATYPN